MKQIIDSKLIVGCLQVNDERIEVLVSGVGVLPIWSDNAEETGRKYEYYKKLVQGNIDKYNQALKAHEEAQEQDRAARSAALMMQAQMNEKIK